MKHSRFLCTVFLAVLCLAFPARADEKSRAELQSDITTTLPSGTQGAITAEVLRDRLTDITDSAFIVGDAVSRTNVTATFTAGLVTDIGETGATIAIFAPPSGGSSNVVTSTVRETKIDTSAGGVTGLGHGIGGFDHLWITGGGSVAQSYAHEARTDIDGGSSATLIESYKPVLNVSGGASVVTHRTVTCLDDDPSSFPFCLYNPDPNSIIDSRGRIFGPSIQEIGPSPGPAYVTGRLYLPEGAGSSVSPGSLFGDGYDWATLIRVRERQSFDAVALGVTTAAASTALRVGLWADASGVPGTLVADAGTISAATTGVKTLSVSWTLEAGDYWLSVANQGSNIASIDWIDISNAGELYGADSGLNIHSTVYTTGHTGALPSSFGTPAFAGSGYTPLLAIRP
ncbi:MAG: hypothetical protein E6R03_01220 [Hyphomicrobiaceae bacterium]|nr:MAG: hypothetical protein E6R03_01220 [Hyphomicrobiaceae bacterium]